MHKLFAKLIVASVVCWTGVPVFSQSSAIVGDATLSLPAITGFEISTASSQSDLEQDRWTMPSNRLLAVYEPVSDGKEGAFQSRRKIAVQSYRKAEQLHVSLSEFQALRSQFRISNQSLLDKSKINAKIHQTKKETALERSVQIGNVQAIEMFNKNSDWSISMLTLVNYTREENGMVREFPIIMSTTIFLLKDKICFLYIYSALDTEDSKNWVKGQTIAWLSKANGIN